MPLVVLSNCPISLYHQELRQHFVQWLTLLTYLLRLVSVHYLRHQLHLVVRRNLPLPWLVHLVVLLTLRRVVHLRRLVRLLVVLVQFFVVLQMRLLALVFQLLVVPMPMPVPVVPRLVELPVLVLVQPYQHQLLQLLRQLLVQRFLRQFVLVQLVQLVSVPQVVQPLVLPVVLVFVLP